MANNQSLENLQTSNHHETMKILMDIKEDIGGIKQHLKNLNGTVASHDISIKEHEKDMDRLNAKINKWTGGLGVGVFIFQLLLWSGRSAAV